MGGRPENHLDMTKHFLVDGRPVTDRGRIANCCNDLYTNIATKLNIGPPNFNFNQFSDTCRHSSSVFNCCLVLRMKLFL